MITTEIKQEFINSFLDGSLLISVLDITNTIRHCEVDTGYPTISMAGNETKFVYKEFMKHWIGTPSLIYATSPSYVKSKYDLEFFVYMIYDGVGFDYFFFDSREDKRFDKVDNTINKFIDGTFNREKMIMALNYAQL